MKTIIREVIALLILLLAILLVIVMFFFDYIKADSNQPQAAIYQLTEDESQILNEKENSIDEQNTIVLSTGYTLTEEQLSQYKANGDLKTGQSNPFDETPVTDVLYDAEGNAYYKVVTNRNEISTGSQWYGTVSGDSRGITTTETNGSATSTQNGNVVVTNTQPVNTVPTNAVTTKNPATTPTPTPTPTQSVTSTTAGKTTQTYNPNTDITAPSTDSGNLSQSSGKK